MAEEDGMDSISLDETLKMEKVTTASSALKKLQSHKAEIDQLRRELAKLEEPGTGIAELRRVVEDASRMQSSLGVDQDLLTRDVLIEAGVPVEDLEQARTLAAAVAACESAGDKARQHLEGGSQRRSPAVLDDLRRLLRSWEDLKFTEGRIKQQQPRRPASYVDLGMERRKMSYGPLCDALLDVAIEMKTNMCHSPTKHEAGGDEDMDQLDERLQALCSEEWAQRALASLDVEIPSSEVFRHGPKGAAGTGSRSRSRTASPVPRSAAEKSPAAAEGKFSFAAACASSAMKEEVPVKAEVDGSVPTFACVAQDIATIPAAEVSTAAASAGDGPAAPAPVPSPLGTSSRIAPDAATPGETTPVNGVATPPGTSEALMSELREQLDAAGVGGSRPAGEASAVASTIAAPALSVPAAAAISVQPPVASTSHGAADRLCTTLGEDITFAGVASAALEAAAAAERRLAASLNSSQPVGCSSPPMPIGRDVLVPQQQPCPVGGPVTQSPPSATSAPAATAVGSGALQQQQSKPVPHGGPEFWHAVHVGDEAAITAFIQNGGCDGRMHDASGHSVLWHACAFNHVRLAKLMIDRFPAGTEEGVDFSEVHPRRGDTLLHVLCQCRPFVKETADVFKRVAADVPTSILQKANTAGITFLALAASSLNFWVLKYVLLHFPEAVKAMVSVEQHNPLRFIADVIAKPVPPASFTPPNPLPEHFPVASMLENGTMFADLAFETGESGNKAGEYARFLAHRVVVATQSAVLKEEFLKLPLEDLSKDGSVKGVVFRVDARISRDVWRSVLQFLYSGKINYTYSKDVGRLIELLRACVMYKLPRPLLDYVQSSLFPLLPVSPPSIALQSFSICTGSAKEAKEGLDVRATTDAATYLLLRSGPEIFSDMDSKEASSTLERMIQTVEFGVFNPLSPPPHKPKQQPAAPAAVPQQAPGGAAGATLGHAAMAPHPNQGYAQGAQAPLQQSFGDQCWRSMPAPGVGGYPQAQCAAAQAQQHLQQQQLLGQQQQQQQQQQQFRPAPMQGNGAIQPQQSWSGGAGKFVDGVIF